MAPETRSTLHAPDILGGTRLSDSCRAGPWQITPLKPKHYALTRHFAKRCAFPRLLVLAVVFQTVTQMASGSRVRRQEGFFCSGDKFATGLLRTIISANVEVIRKAEPIKLGDADHLGLLWLRNGRAYNVHTVRPFGLIESDCDSDDLWIRVVIPLALDAPEFHFDWEAPGGLMGGLFVLSYEKVAANVTIEVPKFKLRGQERSRIIDYRTVASQGLAFGKQGVTGGFSALLATLFTTFNSVSPNVVADLLDILIRRLLQRFIQTVSLPF
ncbi:hypothetical protein HPB49_000092 [Dermacentor silvarum]|uniref:Uncharacterized protein n=1 Tax=Dermacentor silvarum TaxID=543639 RepID=A0ACB8D975_DERSI|nr:hypothetical protein HPB49_000092 [Dermacentor silvarum]